MSSAPGAITYRTALLSDYDGVMAIGSIYGGRDYLWSLYKQLIVDPDKYGIVALDGDRVVGFYMTSTFDGGRTVLKRSGRVNDEYRGRGIFHKLEAELDKHTLQHRPRAAYDVFANTEREDHLSGKFLDMGFQEICRKDMFHMILNSSDLLRPRDITPNKPMIVREANHEDLKLLFNAEDVSRQLFPSGRLLNCYMPYRLLEANIQYMLCERGGAFFSLEDPEVSAGPDSSTNELSPQPRFPADSTNQQQPLGSSHNILNQHLDASSVRNVAMVTFYYCYPTPVGFLYYLDPYGRRGLSPAHFRAHLRSNLDTLQHYFPDKEGKLTVTHDSNIATSDIHSCLKEYGIVDQMTGQEKTQILYERDRALHGLPVEK